VGRARGGWDLARVVPVPRADWREVDGRVVLERPRPSRRGWPGVRERVTFLLSIRRVRLDEVGSFVWRQLDGARTAAQAAAALEAAMGEAVAPAGERVGLFLRRLADLAFVELRVEG
jgi:hypothetical protein